VSWHTKSAYNSRSELCCGGCIWQLYGNYLATIWQLYGNYLATIWQLYGNYMATIWQLYGNYLAVRKPAVSFNFWGTKFEGWLLLLLTQ
jgi:hypothetical protein